LTGNRLDHFWSCIQAIQHRRSSALITRSTTLHHINTPILKLRLSAFDIIDAYLTSIESMSPEDLAHFATENLDTSKLYEVLDYAYACCYINYDLDNLYLIRIGEFLSRMIPLHVKMASIALRLLAEPQVSPSESSDSKAIHHVRIPSVQGEFS